MSVRKGIILAGGTGSRLFPLTQTTSKQLLPVYDKPMIYYPLSVLMLAGIRQIALISRPDHLPDFEQVLGTGAELGLEIEYIAQPRPEGLAQAYLLTEDFLSGAPSAMILGDNLFYGHGLTRALGIAARRHQGATVFGHQVRDPHRYGVVSFHPDGRAKTIEEKPEDPKSDFAVTGLYFLDGSASERARAVRPSSRGELEITDLLRGYLDEGALQVERLGRGYAWFDTGTHDSLLDAGEFVRTIEERQGLKVGCIEEVAFHLGRIGVEQLLRLAEPLMSTSYGQYLRKTALSGHRDVVRDLAAIA